MAVGSGARTEELYHAFSRQIFFFCLHRLRNVQDAEDALQLTFLNVFRALERGVVPLSDAAWLFKIAENVCLTRHRATGRRARVETPEPLPDDVPAPEREVETFDFGGALRSLPVRQRQALVLREWQGLNYAEIAFELGLTRGAVENLLHRARRTLRQAA